MQCLIIEVIMTDERQFLCGGKTQDQSQTCRYDLAGEPEVFPLILVYLNNSAGIPADTSN